MQILDYRYDDDQQFPEYEDYLKNKSVAVIGPMVEHLENGALIDSHDIVVRVHFPLPRLSTLPDKDNYPSRPPWHYPPFIPEEYQSILGSQVNIFFHKLMSYALHEQHIVRNQVHAFLDAGGEFLCVEKRSHRHWREDDFEDYQATHPWRILNPQFERDLQHMLEVLPYPGTMIVADILRHDIKSAFITGFPCEFFSGATVPFFNKHDRQYRIKRAFNNMAWFRDLDAKYSAIDFDDNMRNIFSILPQTLEEYKRCL